MSSFTATTGGGVTSGGGGRPFTKKSASDIRKSRQTHMYRLLMCTSTETNIEKQQSAEIFRLNTADPNYPIYSGIKQDFLSLE